MRILIAGGAGCLGSSLVETYVAQGHELMVIDNFVTGKREVVPELPLLQVVEGSIADRELVESCFARFRPSHVIHSAAAYKDPENWWEDAATNVRGSINIARCCDTYGVRRLIYFQTALCYGRPHHVPIPVDHPTAPFTSYGISKTAGEQYVLMARTPSVSLRLANVTGPRLAIGPIPTFYTRLKEGRSCFCSDTVRDFLDMEDFLALMERCLADEAPTGVFNVSTGEGHTIREVFGIVADHLGLDTPEPPIVPCGPDDVPAVVLDPSATEKAFGWKAQKGFDETIRRMLAWYDAHGVTDIYTHLAPANK